jgi:small-conductance mechanosensitive channel
LDTDALVPWIVVTTATVGGAVAAHVLLWHIVQRLNRKREVFGDLAVRCRAPARLVVGLVAFYIALFSAPISDGIGASLIHATAIAIIGAVAWLLIAAGNVLIDALARKQAIDVADNLKARRVRTQLLVIQRVMTVAVGVLAFAATLTTFSQARAVGTSILASAGVIGLVAGIAARPTIGNLIAGIQLAFTEPIRLDDVVVVEDEWGRVEEITLTYVIISIWDQRRLVVPISYFIETPFENWTRSRAQILGTAFIHADYDVDVDPLRRELVRICEASPLWDGRVAVLQMTDATADSVQIRALVSAEDSGKAWDLRCEVREKLIGYLRAQQPHALPRTRAEVRPGVVELERAGV